MAAAFVARKMGVAATIVVPSSSPDLVVQRLRDEGATVKISGKVSHRMSSCLVEAGQLEWLVSPAWRMMGSFALRFGMMLTLKLSAWHNLKGSRTFLRLTTLCSGTNFNLKSTLSASPCDTFLVPRCPPQPCPRQGHASVIAEVAASLGPDVKPGAVVISVGGGGLLCGVVQGLRDVGWTDVPVVAMETMGAHCFNAAIKAGRRVTLDDITRSGFKGAKMV